MQKTKTIILIIILGVILDISSFLIPPLFNLGNPDVLNPSVISRHAIKGFPLDFFEPAVSNSVGGIHYKFLALNFIINLLIWIFVSFLIVYAYKKLKTKINKPW